MINKLNSVKISFAAIEFTEEEQEIVDAILIVCDNALAKSAEVILTDEYIRETYADKIDEVQALLNSMPEDTQNDFSGKILRKVADKAYEFLMDIFFPEE